MTERSGKTLSIAVASLGLTPGIFVLDGFTPQQIRSRQWHAL